MSEQERTELKEWETPALIVEDVRSATRAGTGNDAPPTPETGAGTDPLYYSS